MDENEIESELLRKLMSDEKIHVFLTGNFLEQTQEFLSSETRKKTLCQCLRQSFLSCEFYRPENLYHQPYPLPLQMYAPSKEHIFYEFGQTSEGIFSIGLIKSAASPAAGRSEKPRWTKVYGDVAYIKGRLISGAFKLTDS